MINPNELRIGNYIQDIISLEVDLIVYKIEDGIITCGDEGFHYPYLAESVKGIILSNEILEKVGFKKINHIHGYSFYSLNSSKVNGCHIDIYPEKTSWMSYSVNHCKYLHQLQNLYYSITGNELQVAW